MFKLCQVCNDVNERERWIKADNWAIFLLAADWGWCRWRIEKYLRTINDLFYSCAIRNQVVSALIESRLEHEAIYAQEMLWVLGSGQLICVSSRKQPIRKDDDLLSLIFYSVWWCRHSRQLNLTSSKQIWLLSQSHIHSSMSGQGKVLDWNPLEP